MPYLNYQQLTLKLIKAVSIMGGATFFPANVTPVAQANICNDPYVAEIVFGAS